MLKFLITALILSLPALSYAATGSEIQIDENSKVTAKAIKVTMIPEPGKSKFFYTRAIWENVFIRITVLTNEKTVITKQYGEKATVFDIREGDILNIEGVLPTSTESLIIQATKIVDTSLLREEKEVRGSVTSINDDFSGFVIKTAKGNNITVKTSGGTTIKKGIRLIPVSELKKGDKVLSVKGTFDYETYIIEATEIEVYQDKNVFTPKNFQGTLKSLSGAVLPANIVVSIGGKDYTVELNEKTIILNKNRGKIELVRFILGDTVRFYGAIRQNDLSIIDAEVLRDMNF